MSKIQDEIIENQNTKKDENRKPRPLVKNATDLQRLRLEKLMKNPDKPIIIPENPKEKDYDNAVPSFVRNVMGSSAGAGSGEFHVYRHLRRKEYARQKQIQAKSVREQLDDDYRDKLLKHQEESELKTAKKRAKRLKKKEKMRQKGKRPKVTNNIDNVDATKSDESDEDSCNETDQAECETEKGNAEVDTSNIETPEPIVQDSLHTIDEQKVIKKDKTETELVQASTEQNDESKTNLNDVDD